MTEKPAPRMYELGMAGLGVMGRNLALNMAGHGFSVAGYDKDPKQVDILRKEAAGLDVHATEDISDFVAALRPPRAVMLLVPAGPPVDAVIKDLLAYLEPGDLIIESVPDEEFGGSHGTLAARLRGYNADAAINAEPTGMLIAPAHRGGTAWKIGWRRQTAPA